MKWKVQAKRRQNQTCFGPIKRASQKRGINELIGNETSKSEEEDKEKAGGEERVKKEDEVMEGSEGVAGDGEEDPQEGYEGMTCYYEQVGGLPNRHGKRGKLVKPKPTHKQSKG